MADNEILEIYRPMNICSDDTKLNWIVGHTSVSHETHSKCQASPDTKRKAQHAKGKCFRCDVCNKSFSKLSVIKKHMLFHGEKTYSCATCCRLFTLPADLKRHQMVHTGVKAYKCWVCEKRFTRSSHLSIHMRIHTGDRPYKCKYCGKSFSESGSLKKHYLTHSGVKSYKCRTCNKTFTTRNSLKYHKQHEHDVETVKLYRCEICERRFAKLSTLTVHMRIHTGDKPYECGSCGMSFTRLDSLKTHLITHTGIKPYKCLKCKQSFTFAGMQYHKLHVHKETNNIKTGCIKVKQCDQAVASEIKAKRMLRKSKQFDKKTPSMKQNSSLNDGSTKSNEQEDITIKQHVIARGVIQIPQTVKNKHSSGSNKSNQLTCAICNKLVANAWSLKKHMVSHTQKLHSCDTCGKSFRLLTSLKNHKRKHSGEKPYKCDFCRRKFSFARGLLAHIRRHTGETPYKYYCTKSFFEINNLKRHIKNAGVKASMDLKDKQSDLEYDFEINTKALIPMPKRFGNITIPINQNHTVKQDIAEMHTYSVEKANEIKNQNVVVSRIMPTSKTRHKSYSEETNSFPDHQVKSGRDITSDIQTKGMSPRWKQHHNKAVSMEQNVARNHEIAQTRLESTEKTDETQKINISESRIIPDPKIKRHKSSEEMKNGTEDTKDTLCDQEYGNKVIFKGLILISKQFDNTSKSMEQSSTLETDIAETSIKSTNQVDETKISSTPCQLEQREMSKCLSSITKFCNLDARRHFALSARNKRNENV